MKPKFDLDDPRVVYLQQLVQTRAEQARSLSLRFEEAVRPVFRLPGPRKTPIQIGSCVLVGLKGQFFALSASHVFDDIGEHMVCVGAGNQLHFLTGDRFSSVRGRSGTHQDDMVDSSAFHIQGEIPSAISSAALSVDDLASMEIPLENTFHVIVGYRANGSRYTNGTSRCTQEQYASVEYGSAEYQALGIDRAKFVALVYESPVLVNGKWMASPSPRGMSGGAILRIEGLPADPRLTPSSLPVAKLAAIITEHRTSKPNRPPALLGSRLGFHLGLIQRYLPNILGTDDDAR
jgi:hypothetical protein